MSRTVLLLPGQGSQFVGMGRELADAFPEVRELYERADDTLGLALSRLCWSGPEDELTATENAQPAILLHSYAVWTLVREVPDVVAAAGHSLGEFTAHLIARTFGFERALKTVRRRGELMAASGAERPGTMAAVIGLDLEELERVCETAAGGTVVPANINAAGQVVISGDVAAVESASLAAADAGARRVIPLNVSGAFHSPLMEAAAGGLAEVLDESALDDPSFPIVANATGSAVESAEAARDTLLAQLTSPVRWTDCMDTLRGFEPERWLELGPGSVLAGLLRRMDRSLGAASVGDPAAVDALMAEG